MTSSIPLLCTICCTLLLVPCTDTFNFETLSSRIFTLEDLVPLRSEFYPERLHVQWISETEYIFREPDVGLVKYNLETNTSATFLNNEELELLNGRATSEISRDGKFMLLIANKRKVYRYSSIADYFIYDIERRAISEIGSGPLQIVVWGSDGALAFVRENNVFYIPDVTHPEIVNILTSRGIPGQVYFGVPDWIYEEEVFNAAEALWFSPSGLHLAVASFNDTLVEYASFPTYGNPGDINFQYPKTTKYKYPKAGRTNPVATLLVYKMNNIYLNPWIILPPVEFVGADNILGRVTWASDEILTVLWLNRRQNISILMHCFVSTEICNIAKEQTESNGWIDINEPVFDNLGTNMLELYPLYFEGQRYMHLARFDHQTMQTMDLTAGNSTVTEVLGWNLKTDTIYFSMIPSNQPWLRQLWASTGGITRCISCKESICRHVSSSFGPGAAYGIVTCSAMWKVPKVFLYNSQDDSLKLINDNSKLNMRLSQYAMPLSLFNTIQLNQVKANIKLLLPPVMAPDMKYPMIVRVYGGPGTSRVKDFFELEYGTYLAVNRSFIVASIDVRGSNAISVDAMHAINNALGTVEVSDTLEAIRRLLQLYSFIDPQRVGVWGWSYGGFVTTMMLINDDQKTLACGAAVAPVTSWLYYEGSEVHGTRIYSAGLDNVLVLFMYDPYFRAKLNFRWKEMPPYESHSIYTERYMDTPQNNPLGYKHSDLMLKARRLRGRRFLLIHGTGDDNVHYQNSLLLAKELQHADIPFEQMTYTDETHSLLGVSRHFFHTLDRFWTKCFV